MHFISDSVGCVTLYWILLFICSHVILPVLICILSPLFVDTAWKKGKPAAGHADLKFFFAAHGQKTLSQYVPNMSCQRASSLCMADDAWDSAERSSVGFLLSSLENVCLISL